MIRKLPTFTPERLTIDSFLGAGSIWDTYLAHAGTSRFVIRLTCPESFPTDPLHDEPSADEVRVKVPREVSLYTGRLRKLQGKVVPYLHGVAVCKVTLHPTADEGNIWMMIMEDGGRDVGGGQILGLK